MVVKDNPYRCAHQYTYRERILFTIHQKNFKSKRLTFKKNMTYIDTDIGVVIMVKLKITKDNNVGVGV